MNKNTWIAVIVIILIILGGWYYQTNKPAPATGEPIKIGVSASLTGPAAFIGESYVAGLRAAESEINNNGGVNGRPIELIIEDNKNLGPGGVSAYRNLRLKSPDLIITTMSAASVPVAPIAKQDNVPLLASLVFADIVSGHDNVVSFFPTPVDDSLATIKDMKGAGIKTAGVIYVNTEYGVASLNAFKTEAEKSGIKIVAEESFTGDTRDFATPVLKLLSKKPEAVMVVAINAVPVINQIKLADHPVIYTNLIPVFGSLVFKSPETFEGVHLTALKTSIDGTSERNKFIKVLGEDKDWAQDTLGYTSVGYDNLKAVVAVMEKNSNPSEFISAFSGFGPFSGINGTINLEGRNIGMTVYPVVFQGGRVVEVK